MESRRQQLAQAVGGLKNPSQLLAHRQDRLTYLNRRLTAAATQSVQSKRHRLNTLNLRLQNQHPATRLAVQRNQWLNLTNRIRQARPRPTDLHRALGQWVERLNRQIHTLVQRKRQGLDVDRTQQALPRLAILQIRRQRQTLDHLTARLNAASPDQILKRGFAMIERPDGHLVNAGRDLLPDQTIRIRMHDHAQHPVNARIVDDQSR